MNQLPEIFEKHFAAHCPPGTTPEQIAERMQANEYYEDKEAWQALWRFYRRHPSAGVDYIAQQAGVKPAQLRRAVEYFDNR